MFASAYKIASNFTKPVIISVRYFDKTVECFCGAFVVLNDEGWIVTVAHLFEWYFRHQQHIKEIKEYEEKKGKVVPNPRWIINYSFWWGKSDIQLKEFRILREGDLIIARLESFPAESVKNFPIFKNPVLNLNLGTSLCKLGYPFHRIKATFNEKTNSFELAPGTLPIPRFPIEGIYTRNALVGRSKDGKYEIKFLETSSPGLRGQSGGPIFDIRGTVWSIQSRTAHFPLGFSPEIEKDGKKLEEHQFLNVGLGIHPELIISFFKDNKVNFKLSDY